MDKKIFFDEIRDNFTLTPKNVNGFNFLIDKALERKLHLDDFSYILATTWHETASTMQPIREYGKGKGRKYGKPGKYGQVPYGRGYVQLTWDFNYERADKELGLKGKLLKNFDLALDPEVASLILFTGMKEGWFTGKGLNDYLDHVDEGDKEDLREFANARRIINGTDKQIKIGKEALIFEKALRKAGFDKTDVENEPVINKTPVEDTEKPVEKVSKEKGPTLPEKKETPQQPSVTFTNIIIKILKALFGKS